MTLTPPTPPAKLPAPFFAAFLDLRHLSRPKPDLIFQVPSSHSKQAGTIESSIEGIAEQLAWMPSPVSFLKILVNFAKIPPSSCGADSAAGKTANAVRTKTQTNAVVAVVVVVVVVFSIIVVVVVVVFVVVVNVDVVLNTDVFSAVFAFVIVIFY